MKAEVVLALEAVAPKQHLRSLSRNVKYYNQLCRPCVQDPNLKGEDQQEVK